MLLRCDTAAKATVVHTIEAFGPVATLTPYANLEEALIIARAGKGSLVLSLFSHNRHVVREVIQGASSSIAG